VQSDRLQWLKLADGRRISLVTGVWLSSIHQDELNLE
jgi:hypothetical protein